MSTSMSVGSWNVYSKAHKMPNVSVVTLLMIYPSDSIEVESVTRALT